MAAAKKASKTAKARKENGDRTIKVLKPNPRRRGTGAHKHFETAARSGTVEKYYKKFKAGADRKNAAAYLSANVRDGFMKLVG